MKFPLYSSPAFPQLQLKLKVLERTVSVPVKESHRIHTIEYLDITYIFFSIFNPHPSKTQHNRYGALRPLHTNTTKLYEHPSIFFKPQGAGVLILETGREKKII